MCQSKRQTLSTFKRCPSNSSPNSRKIPIIFDEYVDMEFGTGALKITPAHDINDYQIGDKHGLPSIDILNDDGTLSEAAQLYHVGKDRFEVRKRLQKT